MSIEDGFLQDIIAHPDDDAPRLIYADWLDEHGRAPTAREFIRVRVQTVAHAHGRRPRAGRSALQHRQEELQQAHAAKNVAGPASVQDCLRHYVFRRGFVEEAALTLGRFLKDSSTLFRLTPLAASCALEKAGWHPRRPVPGQHPRDCPG